jgi:hypothetical protein
MSATPSHAQEIEAGERFGFGANWSLVATVHSFDYDPQSVACTRPLRECRGANVDDAHWLVFERVARELPQSTPNVAA